MKSAPTGNAAIHADQVVPINASHEKSEYGKLLLLLHESFSLLLFRRFREREAVVLMLRFFCETTSVSLRSIVACKGQEIIKLQPGSTLAARNGRAPWSQITSKRNLSLIISHLTPLHYHKIRFYASAIWPIFFHVLSFILYLK